MQDIPFSSPTFSSSRNEWDSLRSRPLGRQPTDVPEGRCRQALPTLKQPASGDTFGSAISVPPLLLKQPQWWSFPPRFAFSIPTQRIPKTGNLTNPSMPASPLTEVWRIPTGIRLNVVPMDGVLLDATHALWRNQARASLLWVVRTSMKLHTSHYSMMRWKA
jgi:hypothetical protein